MKRFLWISMSLSVFWLGVIPNMNWALGREITCNIAGEKKTVTVCGEQQEKPPGPPKTGFCMKKTEGCPKGTRGLSRFEYDLKNCGDAGGAGDVFPNNLCCVPEKTVGCNLDKEGNSTLGLPEVKFKPGEWCGNSPDGSCKTALGTIPIQTGPFMTTLFTIALGFGGIIAVLVIISSGYKIMMSKGDPSKIQEGRETMTAAIIGLLFIIFSLVILQSIGVDILKIPGLGQ